MSEVPDGDFNAGFVVGYQAVKGTAVGIPGIPGSPGAPGNMTAFLLGVRKGIETATRKRWADIVGP